MEKANERNLIVAVGGWRYNRDVIVKKNKVAMEIARVNCQHCPTCAGRIRHCEDALKAQDRKYERAYVGGGAYFELPLRGAMGKDNKEIAAFLAKAMKLQVYVY